jgi:hypothetical protein
MAAKDDGRIRMPIRGVNNRLDDSELSTKEGTWLRGAANIELTRTGRPQRRAGYALVQSGSACHSMWSDPLATACYADGATLYRVRTGPSGISRESVRADLSPGLPLSYGRIGDRLYYSNGIDRGWISPDDAASSWGALPDTTDTESPAHLRRAMPAGAIVRSHLGRLLVARGPTLFFSDPWAPQMYRPDRGRIPFLKDIRLVVPLDTGVFVVTDRTFWLAGDLSDTRQVPVLPYGGVPGTDIFDDRRKVAYWRSEHGLVLGSPDGSVTNLQEEAVFTANGTRGASLLREADGLRKVVSSVSSQEATQLAASGWMAAEIVRKGIEL